LRRVKSQSSWCRTCAPSIARAADRSVEARIDILLIYDVADLLPVFDSRNHICHDVVAMDVSVRELKAKLSDYLKRAAASEEVTVTSHGRPIARLVRVAPQSLHKQPNSAEIRRRLAAIPESSWASPELSKGQSIRFEFAKAKKLYLKSFLKIGGDHLSRHLGGEIVRARTGERGNAA
jgi:prevent-host-death family protein